MACINSSVIGSLTGSLGGITAKKRNGVYYLAAKPASFVPGNDLASVMRRTKFRLLTGFAKTVLSCSDLKHFWKKIVTGNLNSHNLFIKENYKFLNEYGLTNNNRITPSYGLSVMINSITINDDKLVISTDPITKYGSPYYGLIEKIKLFAVIFSHNGDPLNSYKFSIVESGYCEMKYDLPHFFEIMIDPVTLSAIRDYQHHKIFSAIVLFDSNKSPLVYYDCPAYDLLI